MRMIEREYKQKAAAAVAGRVRQHESSMARLRAKEQTMKIQTPSARCISAQQFRDLRRAERLREHPFAEHAP
jgi:hypothetical protein